VGVFFGADGDDCALSVQKGVTLGERKEGSFGGSLGRVSTMRLFSGEAVQMVRICMRGRLKTAPLPLVKLTRTLKESVGRRKAGARYVDGGTVRRQGRHGGLDT
jgi:hypothetical protein